MIFKKGTPPSEPPTLGDDVRGVWSEIRSAIGRQSRRARQRLGKSLMRDNEKT